MSFAARVLGRCRVSSDRLLRSAHGAAIPRRWGRRSGARRARALHREFYTEAGGEGELGDAMLNDVLAVGVASAVVVVMATILGVVELL